MPLEDHVTGDLSLAIETHVKYIQSLDTKRDELDYWLTEHLRLNGVYWGLTALHLLGRPDALPRGETIDFVLSCQHESGGFGAAPEHDAHMLSTVSAVQILAMVDALDELETRGTGKARVGKCGFFHKPLPSQLLLLTWRHVSNMEQTLQTCKIQRRVASLAMNGAKRILAFYTAR